jgi:predicted Zn-dependent peptidase
VSSNDNELQINVFLSGHDLQHIQSRTKASISIQRHYHHRGIGGSCSSDQTELLLCMLYLRLSRLQHFDEKELEKSKNIFCNSIAAEVNSPYHVFLERARILTCGDSITSRPYTTDIVNSITIDKMRQFFQEYFVQSFTEFSYVFIGDLPPLSEIIPMLEYYIGHVKLSTPNDLSNLSKIDDTTSLSNPLSVLKQCDIVKPTKYIHEAVTVRGLDADKSSSMAVFVITMPGSENDFEDYIQSLYIDTTCKLLQSRLLDVLRMKLGKVYSVSVERSRNSLSEISLISIGYHCDTKDLSLLHDMTFNEIRNLQNSNSESGFTQSEIDAVKESMFKTHQVALTQSSHWLFWILDTLKAVKLRNENDSLVGNSVIKDNSKSNQLTELKNGIRMRSIDKDQIIRNIQLSDVNQILKKYFDLETVVVVDLKPQIKETVSLSE